MASSGKSEPCFSNELTTEQSLQFLPIMSGLWASKHPHGEMPEQTLIEHWNGKVWSIVPSPNVGTAGGNLIGLVVVNKDNIWAVGVSSAGFTSFAWRTLIEH